VVKFGKVVNCLNRTSRDPAADGLERVVGLDHMDSESLPLRRWDFFADLPDGTSFTRTFRAGQVLFGKRRAYQRKVSVPDFDGICSGDILVLEVSSDIMLQGYLPFVVQSDGFFEHALGTSAGSLSPRTKWQELAKYEFALPSLNEQRSVIEYMAAANAVVTATERLLQSIDTFEVAVIQNSLESGGVTLVDLGAVAKIERGCSYKSEDYTPKGVGRPFLNLKSVTRSGRFSPSGVKWVRGDFRPESTVLPGDLFFANTDLTPGKLLVGAPFFFPGFETGANPCFSMDLSRVVPKNSDLELRYLYYVLRLPRIRKEMRSLTGGSTVGHLRLSSVNKMKVPILNAGDRRSFLETMSYIENLRDTTVQYQDSGRLTQRELRRMIESE